MTTSRWPSNVRCKKCGGECVCGMQPRVIEPSSRRTASVHVSEMGPNWGHVRIHGIANVDDFIAALAFEFGDRVVAKQPLGESYVSVDFRRGVPLLKERIGIFAAEWRRK